MLKDEELAVSKKTGSILQLIKEYPEGLKTFICLSCGHTFNIQKNGLARCIYCGAKDEE